MKRAEFEHVINAAADIVKDEIVVVGSHSVLGGFLIEPSFASVTVRGTGHQP